MVRSITASKHSVSSMPASDPYYDRQSFFWCVQWWAQRSNMDISFKFCTKSGWIICEFSYPNVQRQRYLSLKFSDGHFEIAKRSNH
jgi:hypothetical protein